MEHIEFGNHSMQGFSVTVNLARGVVDGAVKSGISRDMLLKRTDLSEYNFSRHDGRVSYKKYLQIWNSVAELTDDQDFGLHLAERHMGASDIGLVGFLIMNCTHFGQLIDSVSKYRSLINNCAVQRYQVDRREFKIIEGPKTAIPWTRHHAEMTMAIYMVLSRRWTNEALRPIRVNFTHMAPKKCDEHERIFQAPVRFGQQRCELVFSREAFDLPLRHPEPQLLLHLEQLAKEKLKHLTMEDIAEKAYFEIKNRLCDDLPRLDHIARKLGMGSRTLQRRLEENNTSFQQLVDKVRWDLACDFLKNRKLTVTECSYRLGFANIESFRRAFKRWTGVAPSVFRKQRS